MRDFGHADGRITGQVSNKSLRILITPNVACAYDQRMVKGLAGGFNSIGHCAGALMAPQNAAELAKLCESLSIDVVIQVNRTRDRAHPLPPAARHISWYQDVYPETQRNFAEKFESSDILYSLGDPKVLGLHAEPPCYTGTLFTGVGPSILNFKGDAVRQDLDFSLCGGLPLPVKLEANRKLDLLWYYDALLTKFPLFGRTRLLWLIRKLLFSKKLPADYVPYAAMQEMLEVVEGFYRPLRGELDIHQLAEAMRPRAAPYSVPPTRRVRKRSRGTLLAKVLRPFVPAYNGRSDMPARLMRYLAGESSFLQEDTSSSVDKAISYFSQSYPRFMDRVALVEAAAGVSESLELWGPGLGDYEFARPYFKGVIEDQNELLKVYCRSKINLANNTHGLGLHSRTLECMAVGGFIFMHESPHDFAPGGMRTAFEPDVHYGAYTPETFHEEAERWLRDDKKRLDVGRRARALVADQHCWHHRAQQIINDLNR